MIKETVFQTPNIIDLLNSITIKQLVAEHRTPCIVPTYAAEHSPDKDLKVLVYGIPPLPEGTEWELTYIGSAVAVHIIGQDDNPIFVRPTAANDTQAELLQFTINQAVAGLTLDTPNTLS